jgi:AcrR family transcriptional regulator
MSDTGQFSGFDHEKVVELLAGMDPGIDRRARRTRQALHQALMRLILERDYDAISVADIADGANVGRSTFYAHFSDKDDLLRNTAANLRFIVVKEHAAHASRSASATDRVVGFSHFMTHHLYEQRRLFGALMKGQAGQIVLALMKQVLCDLVRNELRRLPVHAKGRPGRETAVQFIVGSYIALITWWLENGAREKPESLHASFVQLVRSGLVPVLG